MAFANPDEIITALVLVIPGFVSMSIVVNAVGLARRLDTTEFLTWSVFLSAFMDGVLVWFFGLPNPFTPPQFLAAVATFWGLFAYGLLVLATGLLGALLLRANPARAFQRVVWAKSKDRKLPITVWDLAMPAHKGQWALVELIDGKKVKGVVTRYSMGEEDGSVYLSNPRGTYEDENGKEIETPMGAAILVQANQIRSIVFFQAPDDLSVVEDEQPLPKMT